MSSLEAITLITMNQKEIDKLIESLVFYRDNYEPGKTLFQSINMVIDSLMVLPK